MDHHQLGGKFVMQPIEKSIATPQKMVLAIKAELNAIKAKIAAIKAEVAADTFGRAKELEPLAAAAATTQAEIDSPSGRLTTIEDVFGADNKWYAAFVDIFTIPELFEMSYVAHWLDCPLLQQLASAKIAHMLQEKTAATAVFEVLGFDSGAFTQEERACAEDFAHTILDQFNAGQSETWQSAVLEFCGQPRSLLVDEQGGSTGAPDEMELEDMHDQIRQHVVEQGMASADSEQLANFIEHQCSTIAGCRSAARSFGLNFGGDAESDSDFAESDSD
jgi:hypothetical protein